MIDCKEITPTLRPIEKLIYDTIDNQNLRVVFATDKHARDLAAEIVLCGYNSGSHRDIVNYNEYIFEKYNVDLFKTCPNIKSTEALYNLFLRDGEGRVNEKTLFTFRPIEKLIYDAINSPNLRTEFATDDRARELAATVIRNGYNDNTYRDIDNYNAYISEKYNVDMPKFDDIKIMTKPLYDQFLMNEDTADVVADQEEPEIVNYKACWEALRDHVDHVIDRLSESKRSSTPTLLSSYLDISSQMKFIEELDLNSRWAKLSTADKIKALQNVGDSAGRNDIS